MLTSEKTWYHLEVFFFLTQKRKFIHKQSQVHQQSTKRWSICLIPNKSDIKVDAFTKIWTIWFADSSIIEIEQYLIKCFTNANRLTTYHLEVNIKRKMKVGARKWVKTVFEAKTSLMGLSFVNKIPLNKLLILVHITFFGFSKFIGQFYIDQAYWYVDPPKIRYTILPHIKKTLTNINTIPP